MATAKPRPYRRILTSALHRRFVHASALSLLVCYLISILIGDKSSFFWALFPVGASGIRAVLLFISSLSIFVLRVGQMHIGSRMTGSAINTFRYLFPLDILQTFAWYLLSAWWFSEIYKWSSPISAHLEWVNRGSPSERASLNERPIYIYTYHLLLAVVQSVAHLYCDYDRVPVLVAEQLVDGAEQRTHPRESVTKRIQAGLPQLLRDGLLRSAIVSLICPVAYTFFLRRRAWSYTMSFAKLFWDFPRSAADPPGLIPPVSPFLITRTLISGGLLVLCWQTTNLFFSIFLSQAPLKRGQPLTSEAKDPNGSLLNGLQAKKETVRAFAFWELCFISQQSPDRRKAIFNDIDREGGSAWNQILQSATEIVQSISTRINEKETPSGSEPSPTEKSEPAFNNLPRLTDPLKEQNIFASSPKPISASGKLGDAFSTTLRSLGDSPDWTPTTRARARDVFNRASSVVLSPKRKQRLLGSSQEIKALTGGSFCSNPQNIHPFLSQLLRSPIGLFIRQTYARRLSSIVLNTPTSTLSSTVDAIESLTHLLITSLDEDPYGKVQADVPGVVRLFTETYMTLESYAHGGLNIHWTDATFPPSTDPAAQAAARRVPDVELIINSLKRSLGSLLVSFRPYYKDVGLIGKDLRLAKEAAGIVEDLNDF
ncbi:nucleoporin protein Ndc1-Nup [Aspergillus californicus]